MTLFWRCALLLSGLLVAACQVDDIHSDWMASHQNSRLGSLTLMGSHDAGMFKPHIEPEISACTGGAMFNIAVTQTYDILGQLKSGARVFDVRPVIHRGLLYTGHGTKEKIDAIGLSLNAGCHGQGIESLLRQVTRFLEAHPTEVVILNVGHINYMAGMFSQASPAEVAERFKQMVEKHAGHLLVRPSAFTPGAIRSDLWEMRVADFVAANRRLIVSMECDFVEAGRGFVGCLSKQSAEPVPVTLGDTVGSWANSPHADVVIERVEASWQRHVSSGTAAGFDLSWTATQDNNCIAASFVYKLTGKPMTEAPYLIRLGLEKAGITLEGYDHCRSIKTTSEPLQARLAGKLDSYTSTGVFCPNRRPRVVSLDFITPALGSEIIALNDATNYVPNTACAP